jgi:hypothetical protein
MKSSEVIIVVREELISRLAAKDSWSRNELQVEFEIAASSAIAKIFERTGEYE